MKFGFVTCVQLGLSCLEEIYECGGAGEMLGTLTGAKAGRGTGRRRTVSTAPQTAGHVDR